VGLVLNVPSNDVAVALILAQLAKVLCGMRLKRHAPRKVRRSFEGKCGGWRSLPQTRLREGTAGG
jgi:hypothetical protein